MCWWVTYLNIVQWALHLFLLLLVILSGWAPSFLLASLSLHSLLSGPGRHSLRREWCRSPQAAVSLRTSPVWVGLSTTSPISETPSCGSTTYKVPQQCLFCQGKTHAACIKSSCGMISSSNLHFIILTLILLAVPCLCIKLFSYRCDWQEYELQWSVLILLPCFCCGCFVIKHNTTQTVGYRDLMGSEQCCSESGASGWTVRWQHEQQGESHDFVLVLSWLYLTPCQCWRPELWEPGKWQFRKLLSNRCCCMGTYYLMRYAEVVWFMALKELDKKWSRFVGKPCRQSCSQTPWGNYICYRDSTTNTDRGMYIQTFVRRYLSAFWFLFCWSIDWLILLSCQPRNDTSRAGCHWLCVIWKTHWCLMLST